MPPVVVGIIAIAAGIGIGTATVVGGLLIAFGISSIAGALFKASGTSGGQTAIEQGFTSTVTSAVAPRKLLYGTRLLSGPLVYIETFGGDNDWLHMIIALTGHPVEDITHVYINDDPAPIAGSPWNPDYDIPVDNITGAGGNWFWKQNGAAQIAGASLIYT